MDFYPFTPTELALIACALAALPTFLYLRIESASRGAWSRSAGVARHGVGAYRATEVSAPPLGARAPWTVRGAAFVALCVGQMALPLAGLAGAWLLGPAVVGDLGVFVPDACGGRLAIANFAPLIWLATGAGAVTAVLCVASARALLRRTPGVSWLVRATSLSALVASGAVAGAYALAERSAAGAHDVIYNGCMLRSGAASAWVGPLALPYTSMTPWSALAAFAALALVATLLCLPLGARVASSTAPAADALA